jgi:OOP family OmpA-OmpF porin
VRIKFGLFGMTALILFSTLAQAGITSMRGPLFETTDAARSKAEQQQARLLAPISYGEAVGYYERAESTFKRAGSLDSIRRYLGKAQAKFDKAAELAALASTALDTTIQARKDAFASEAKDYASDDWRDGETNFSEATKRLERGSMKYALRYATKAETAYREAELIAIKANYLSETKDLLKQAEKLRAKKYAPMSLNNARILLETAETELESKRYDTDRPRLLALEAKHNALHAIYVSKLERQIRAGSTNLEGVLLDWEASISKIGEQLNKPVYFDDGEKAPVAVLLAGISDLQYDKENLQQDLRDNQAQVTALNNQVSKMQTMIAEVSALQQEKDELGENLGDQEVQVALLNARLAKMQVLLGGGNQTIEELEILLEQQAQHRERFAQVENMFPADQAAVFRQGDTVIMRLIGLNFDSGVAQLKSEHEIMLATLKQAINVFPDSRVIVEGHTDAFGSDAQNQSLSQSRAESVVQHLVGAMALSPANLNSVGYGETRPVANNETEEGRKRNRRIDVVIQPSWVTQDTLASVN